VFFGSGAPTVSAAAGSIYLRSDGASYINTNGTTGWVPNRLDGYVTNAAATYSWTSFNSTVVQTTAASTHTLPTASTNTGRTIRVVTQFAGAVISNASNVIPLAGGSAGTAILAATAGKWADLISNGTNWVIVAAN
jgi:hypothetical protein